MKKALRDRRAARRSGPASAPRRPTCTATLRQLRQRRDQALGRGRQGLGRQARLMYRPHQAASRHEGALIARSSRCPIRAKLNAIDVRDVARAARRVRAAAAHAAADAPRAVVVRGEGGQFCAGRRHRPSSPAFRFDEARAARLPRERGRGAAPCPRCSLASCRCVAQIDGACIGGGLEIASCCDIRICGASSALRRADREARLSDGAGARLQVRERASCDAPCCARCCSKQRARRRRCGAATPASCTRVRARRPRWPREALAPRRTHRRAVARRPRASTSGRCARSPSAARPTATRSAHFDYAD